MVRGGDASGRLVALRAVKPTIAMNSVFIDKREVRGTRSDIIANIVADFINQLLEKTIFFIYCFEAAIYSLAVVLTVLVYQS